MPDRVVAKVYTRAGALQGTLTEDTGRRWLDTYNDSGSGSLEVPNASSERALIDYDRIIRFELDGTARFAFIVDELESVTLNDEESSEATRASGAGTLSMLDEWAIPQTRGTGALPIEDTRTLSFASPQFVESVSWVAATQIIQQHHTTPTLWIGKPTGWVEPTAFWVWASSGSTTTAPLGLCLFRRTVNVGGSAIRARLFCTADNFFRAYTDGQEVITVLDGYTWTDMFDVELDLSAGEHTLAFAVENVTTSSPGGLLFALYALNDDGTLGTLLAKSDSTTKVLPYPDPLPGFTVGEATAILLDEAQDAGYLTTVTLDDNTTTVYGAISMRVGDSLQTFLRAQTEGRADVEMDAVSDELRLWDAGDRGTHTGLTLDLEDTGDLIDHAGRAEAVNEILGRCQDGWFLVTAATSGPKKRASRAYGELTLAEATELANAELAALTGARVRATAVLASDSVAEPYTDFDVADWVTVTAMSLATAEQRARTVHYDEDDEGNPVWTVEFNDQLLEAEERVARWLTRMAPGAGGGRSIHASPVAPATVRGAKTDLQEIPPHSFDQGSGTSADWDSTLVATVVQVKATCTPAGTSSSTAEVILNGSTVATVTVPSGTQTVLEPVKVNIEPGDKIRVETTWGTDVTGMVVDLVAV